MAQGLRIRDDAGTIILDEFTSISTNIAIVTVGKTNGSYTLPATVPGKASYAVFPGGSAFYAPEITITNGDRTINWTWTVSGHNANSVFQMYVGVV